MIEIFVKITDWLAIIVYPILFIQFLLLAILAIVDNVNRLQSWERVVFHVILALIFMILGLINPIVSVISLDVGRRIVRLLSVGLILVALPSTIRSTLAVWREWKGYL